MTSYNELRDGQEFYSNGYKKGYEDAKKEIERALIMNEIAKAIGRAFAVLIHKGVVTQEEIEYILEPLKKVEAENE